MTSTDLVLRTAQESGFTATAVELIRNTAAKGCNDDEVAQLLIIASRTGLDPLARQVYMIQRWDGRAGRNVATPQTSIDGYRLIADRTNKYAPGRAPTYEYDAGGQLFAATAYVKKAVAGTWHEIAATAFWDEYAQRNKQGGLTPLWEKMPRLMLAKCAEALALRRAFPAELSGLYTAEEMAQADTPTVTVETETAQETPAKPVPQTSTTAGISALQLRHLHALGREVYGNGWDAKRPELVKGVTKGEATSSKDLTPQEAAYLIERMEHKAAEKRAAQEAESYEVPAEATTDFSAKCEECNVAEAIKVVAGRNLCDSCAQRAGIAADVNAKRGKPKAAA